VTKKNDTFTVEDMEMLMLEGINIRIRKCLGLLFNACRKSIIRGL
jgi:hypothetical protein